MLELDADEGGRVDLKGLLNVLGQRKIASLLVEGGAGINTSFLKEHLVDRLIAVLAPKIVGTGINAVGDLGILQMENALRLSYERVTRSGDDLIFDARFNPRSQPDAPPP